MSLKRRFGGSVDQKANYASITFATVVVRFICLRFSLRFFRHRRRLRSYDVCVYIAYDHLTISFGDKLGQNLTETLRISCDNRMVIVQSSCYLHDLPI